MYAIPFRNKKGEIEINTVMPKLNQNRTNILEIGHKKILFTFKT